MASTLEKLSSVYFRFFFCFLNPAEPSRCLIERTGRGLLTRLIRFSFYRPTVIFVASVLMC